MTVTTRPEFGAQAPNAKPPRERCGPDGGFRFDRCPMIEVTCDCGKHLRVKEEHAGKSFHCPACGARLDAIEADNASLRRTLGRHRVGSDLIACSLLFAVGGLFVNARDPAAHRVQPATPARLPKIIEAEGFVVRDEQGKNRAALWGVGSPLPDRPAAIRPSGS